MEVLNMKFYEHIVVAHLLGELEASEEIVIPFNDYAERAEIVNGIVDDWNEKMDVHDEEKSDISQYAVRVLHKTFFRAGNEEE